jgi:hypothetical protein
LKARETQCLRAFCFFDPPDFTEKRPCLGVKFGNIRFFKRLSPNPLQEFENQHAQKMNILFSDRRKCMVKVSQVIK